MENSKGSTWGKWDLQVQTILDDGYVSLANYSEDLRLKDEEKWAEYIVKVGGEEDALLFDSKAYFNDDGLGIKERCDNYARNMVAFLSVYNPELKAMVITDHNYDHSQLVDSLVRYSSKSHIKIIPGVEINVGGVHMLAFFGEIPFDQTSYSVGLKIFQSKIGIDSKLNERGSLTVTQHNIIDVIDLIKDNGGSVIFPHCNSDNGLFQERQKADRENLADIFNHSDCNILQAQSGIVAGVLDKYVSTNDNLKSLHCVTIASDSRRLLDIGRPDDKGNYQWIKADPTFRGLCQVLSEPSDRIYVGAMPYKVASITENKDKYIRSITINHTSPSEDTWFNQSISLNPGLVAIIGKKGSGKSALTDILALAGSSHVTPDNFSFLTPKKFLKRNLGSNYEYTMVWEDEEEEKDTLSRQVEPTRSPERVKYLPQKYVESICDEFGVSKSFQDEIDRVIFSYVPVETRLGRTNLKDLLAYKDAAIEKSIITQSIKLSEINRDIEKLENKKKPDYAELVKEKIVQKKQQLANLKEPPVVVKPKEGGEGQNSVGAFNTQIDALDEVIKKAEEELTETNSKLERVKILSSQIATFEESYAVLLEDIEGSVKEFGVDASKLIKVTINKAELTTHERQITAARQKLEKQLGKGEDLEGFERNYILERQKLVAERDEVKGKLGKEDTVYQNYVEALKQLEVIKQSIVGTEADGTLDTIKSLEAELDYLVKSLDADLTRYYGDRRKIVEEIFNKKREKIEYYEEIYKPLTNVLEAEKATQEEADSVLEFKVEPVFDKQRFITQFEKYIDQRGRGNFRGKSDGIKRLLELLDAYDLKTSDSVLQLIDKIIELLQYEINGDQRQEVDIDKQLLGVTRGELYNFLFGIEYIEVQYNLRFNGKDLSEDQFSPGEKGALLLIFYLLIEKGKVPLIIDQPEENLDNESVFELLVPYIRRAKKERQVILVTHNPNLAVVCDAEQIIHTTMNKKQNTIRYGSGSLENPFVNKKVSDVLEGTLPAFDIRNSKYYRTK